MQPVLVRAFNTFQFNKLLFLIFQKYIWTAQDAAKLAEAELSRTGQAIGAGLQNAADTANSSATQVASTIDQTKAQAGAAVATASSVAEQTKKAANEAINQGLKAAEQAVDAQVQHAEKVFFYGG